VAPRSSVSNASRRRRSLHMSACPRPPSLRRVANNGSRGGGEWTAAGRRSQPRPPREERRGQKTKPPDLPATGRSSPLVDLCPGVLTHCRDEQSKGARSSPLLANSQTRGTDSSAARPGQETRSFGSTPPPRLGLIPSTFPLPTPGLGPLASDTHTLPSGAA
jgi:hypothetical protein